MHGLCYEAKTDNGSGPSWHYENVDLGRLYSLKLWQRNYTIWWTNNFEMAVYIAQVSGLACAFSFSLNQVNKSMVEDILGLSCNLLDYTPFKHLTSFGYLIYPRHNF